MKKKLTASETISSIRGGCPKRNDIREDFKSGPGNREGG